MNRHYSESEKALVLSYYQSGYSCRGIGQELGIPYRRITEWLNQYRTNGFIGLPSRSCRRYPIDLKQSAVREVLENSLSCEVSALKYGVSTTAVVNWVKRVKRLGYDSLSVSPKPGRSSKIMGRPRKKTPQTDLEKLQEENARLKAEVALLKKVKALVEEREARQRAIGLRPSKN